MGTQYIFVEWLTREIPTGESESWSVIPVCQMEGIGKTCQVGETACVKSPWWNGMMFPEKSEKFSVSYAYKEYTLGYIIYKGSGNYVEPDKEGHFYTMKHP